MSGTQIQTSRYLDFDFLPSLVKPSRFSFYLLYNIIKNIKVILMKKGILFCCFCFVAFHISGCEGPAGPVGPAAQNKYSVFGQVEFTADTLPTNAQVIVSNISSIPTVKLNQSDLRFRSVYSSGSNYWDTLRTITQGDEVQLTISGNQGEAGATVRIPRQFRIQSPDPDSIFILLPHSNFSASWTTSGFSDYYYAYFYLYYSYVPTGGGYKYFSFDIDTILSTTSILIPADKLFPPDFDSLTSNWYNEGALNIEAVNGPRPEVGAQGNVTGGGIGFFFGKSDGGYLDIRVQNSTTTDSGTKLKYDLKREQSEKFYKKYLEWQEMN
jgi:hypothetical protein